MQPGDLVVQFRTWPDGYAFRIIELAERPDPQRPGETIEVALCEPLDHDLRPATEPGVKQTHVALNGVAAFDKDGLPILVLERDHDNPVPVPTQELLVEGLRPYPED